MPPANFTLVNRYRITCVIAAGLVFAHPATGQKTASPLGASVNGDVLRLREEPVLVRVRVLDAGGLPLESTAQVRLFSKIKPVNITTNTREASMADFPGIPPGDYEIEVISTGFKKTEQHLHVVNSGMDYSVFVYVHPASEPDSGSVAKSAMHLKPKLQDEINKGLEFMQKKQYDKANLQFAKASRSAPDNPNLWYLQGTAELTLKQKDVAQKDFERALALDPAHERALLAMAQLQMEGGDTAAAIQSLEKAYHSNGAGWRTHYLLASAYAQTGRLPDAELHASRAVDFAGRDAAPAMMLLGEIQYREGKKSEARQTWERLATRFPGSAVEAKQLIAKTANESDEPAGSVIGNLPLALPPELESSPEKVAWAPPDVDSKEYPTASGVTCQADQVLDLAENRLKSQLLNFERFTATEHIVHQEIDRSGVPGPPKEKQFSYIVFVQPYAGKSLYLEESRDGGFDYASFPTSVVTTGLNGLGVALVQPVNREEFVYACEGLANLRGQAAWQIRFQEKKDSSESIRRWRTNKAVYDIRLKGRMWVTSTSYDMLRIETDLLEPVRELELMRDHLEVNYGPVNFQDGKQWLWLPWNAEMYMEYRHRRYHHQHFLTNYLLFGVETNEKVNNPKIPQPDTVAPSQ